MNISSKINLLSVFLLSGFIFLLGFSVYSLNTIISSIYDVNNIFAYLNRIRECDILLISQLSDAQQIALSGTDSVDGDLLTDIRLINSGLKNKIEELESAPLPESVERDSYLSGSFRHLYSTINDELIKRIFNNEDFNPSDMIEIIISEHKVLQKNIKEYESGIDDSLSLVLSRNNTYRLVFIIIFSVSLLLLTIVTAVTIIFMRKSVINPVKKTASEILKLTEGTGSLYFRFDDKRNDEIGELCSNFNLFIEMISSLVGKIGDAGLLSKELGLRLEDDIRVNSALSGTLKKSVSDFDTYFQDLSGVISEIKQITDRISFKSNNSKKIITNQKTVLDTASLSIDKTVIEIGRLRDSGKDSLLATNELKSSASYGINIIKELDRQIEDILSAAGNLLSINQVISDISDRTRVLGVNAAIEAARAGITGRGFKIVSGEIAALGSEVRENAVKTEHTLKTVLQSVQELKYKSESGMDKFTMIGANAENVFDSVSDIIRNLVNHENHEKELIQNIREQNSSSVDVAAFISDLDSGISDIFSSVKRLDENLITVKAGIKLASESADQLKDMTSRLERTGEENQSVTGTLNNYIEHFSSPDV